jgi:hypothetical protein
VAGGAAEAGPGIPGTAQRHPVSSWNIISVSMEL